MIDVQSDPMLLLADSGSTKTTWILLDDGFVKKTVNTPGLNPYFLKSETIEAILKADLIPELFTDFIKEIHFYGAGCSTMNNNKMLKNSMAVYFRNAEISVYHDILGAARALFGNEKGIAGILGTGCNSCYYDGKEIYTKVPSLGYLFGDEGAGSYLGKLFISHYLKETLPDDLRKEFDKKYRFNLEDMLNALYNRPFPNRFLASFSKFIAPRKNHPFMHELVASSFISFFEAQISKYSDYQRIPVSFVGSIAFIYRDILREAAKEYGIKVGTISQSPVEGLIKFHVRSEE
jgi:glucosamine kinase